MAKHSEVETERNHDGPAIVGARESADKRESTTSGAPLLGLLWDAGIPVLGFYALHLLGASDWMALLAATLFAGGRVFWVALRSRRITWFAPMMMLVFGGGAGVGF